VGYKKIIDTNAAATQHVDQGLSLTLFFKDTATTRDVNKAQIYAWTQGVKTLYYVRVRQMALAGTAIEGCVSCMLSSTSVKCAVRLACKRHTFLPLLEVQKSLLVERKLHDS